MIGMIVICIIVIASIVFVLIVEDAENDARKERWEKFFQTDYVKQTKTKKQILELVTNRRLK